MTRINTIDDVQARTVMTPDGVARWNGLPPDEQLARLRAAIQRGIDSGHRTSPWTTSGPGFSPLRRSAIMECKNPGLLSR